jgi:hypothetical protein
MPLPLRERVEIIRSTLPQFWARPKAMYDFAQEKKDSRKHVYYNYINTFLRFYVYDKNYDPQTLLTLIDKFIQGAEDCIKTIDRSEHPQIAKERMTAVQVDQIREARDAKDLIESIIKTNSENELRNLQITF